MSTHKSNDYNIVSKHLQFTENEKYIRTHIYTFVNLN
jgi:hypothetical protein